MTTEYTGRATIFGHPTKISDLNQLSLVLGESASDDQTFTAANYQHPVTKEEYCVVSAAVKPVFSEMAAKPLVPPEHAKHADIGAATRVQQLLSINDKLPSPDWIAVRLSPRHKSTQQHIAEYGLVPIEHDV